MPLGSGGPRFSVITGSPVHVSSLSGPVARTGIRPVPRDRRLEVRPYVPSPAAFRLLTSASRASCPAEEFHPSCDRPTEPEGPDPDRVSTFRAYEIRPGWAPRHPGASGIPTTGGSSPVVAGRLFQPGSCTLVSDLSPKAWADDASSRVHLPSPVRSFPRPVVPPDGAGALGLLPWLRTLTGRTCERTPGRELISNTDQELRHRSITGLLSASSLVMRDFQTPRSALFWHSEPGVSPVSGKVATGSSRTQ